jgi:hypothetical protein
MRNKYSETYGKITPSGMWLSSLSKPTVRSRWGGLRSTDLLCNCWSGHAEPWG